MFSFSTIIMVLNHNTRLTPNYNINNNNNNNNNNNKKEKLQLFILLNYIHIFCNVSNKSV